MAKIGDFVTAQNISTGSTRQGVLVEMSSMRAIVRGELDDYICQAHGMVTVPDSNLFGSAVQHVNKVRKSLI